PRWHRQQDVGPCGRPERGILRRASGAVRSSPSTPGALARLRPKHNSEVFVAEVRSIVGSCHCGNVRYEVSTDLKSVMACNCSICSRSGYLLTFVPEDQFKLLSGEGRM